MTETQLSKSIRDTLERAGFWVERIFSGSARVRGGFIHGASNGTPDLMVLDPFGFLEVKLPGKDLENDQVLWHVKAAGLGHRIATVRSEEQALRTVMGWRK